jgi:hypothetical protein
VRPGDLVRPRVSGWSDQVGIVIGVGYFGSVSVRLMNGKIMTYNRSSLEVLSESR